jgi:23S rRNA (pseudouridine1915-N3)-methyltransferase
MKITLITVGTLKEDYLRRAMEEYVRRIGAYATWEEINLKEEKLKDESPSSVDAALKAEGERIVSALPKDALAIALCVEGKQYSSEELAALLGRGADEKGKVCLVIGSSWGLSEEVKRACHVRLSVSKMTFPHQLMRVILGEAIYRSLTILKGKKYHK